MSGMMDSDSDDDQVEQLQFKVIVVGDGAVGKTSLINRFCQDGFAQSYKQTIGVDFFNKRVTLPSNVQATLQIWDIGGQQIGGKMLGKYIYGSAAVILVYDITNPESFKNLEDWLDFVRQAFQNVPQNQHPHLALVGNKIDLNHMRAVKSDKHSLFASENQMSSHFVSAKSGEHVNSLFIKVAAELAGITLSKSEVEVEEKVVTAQIVNHPAAPLPKGPQGPEEEKDEGGCEIM